jgi:hypothetical protein
MEYTLTLPKNHKVDVSNNGLLNILGTRLANRSWRHRYPDSFHYNKYVLEINSNDTTRNTTIEGFGTLGKLLRSQICMCRPDNGGIADQKKEPALFATNANYQISICFHIAEALTMKNLRSDIVPLIEATLLSKNGCPITIAVRNKTKNASHTITLHQLRQYALTKWPKVDAVDPKPCSEMWINGLGQVVEVNEPKAVTGKKRNAEVEHKRQAEGGRKKKKKKKGMSKEPECPVGGSSYEVLRDLVWKVEDEEDKSKGKNVGKGKDAESKTCTTPGTAGGKRK